MEGQKFTGMATYQIPQASLQGSDCTLVLMSAMDSHIIRIS